MVLSSLSLGISGQQCNSTDMEQEKEENEAIPTLVMSSSHVLHVKFQRIKKCPFLILMGYLRMSF